MLTFPVQRRTQLRLDSTGCLSLPLEGHPESPCNGQKFYQSREERKITETIWRYVTLVFIKVVGMNIATRVERYCEVVLK